MALNIVHSCCFELNVPMSSEGRWGKEKIESFSHTRAYAYTPVRAKPACMQVLFS